MGAIKEIRELAIAIIVALVLYQAASLLLGTHVPVTAVVSMSMEHSTQLNAWWASKEGEYVMFNITKKDFLSFPYREGMYVGDMVLVANVTPQKGDVIVYHPRAGCFPNIRTSDTIIHRVVSTEPLITKGDNNSGPDVTQNGQSCIVSVEGTAVLGAPLLGYPRLLLFLIAKI